MTQNFTKIVKGWRVIKNVARNNEMAILPNA